MVAGVRFCPACLVRVAPATSGRATERLPRLLRRFRSARGGSAPQWSPRRPSWTICGRLDPRSPAPAHLARARVGQPRAGELADRPRRACARGVPSHRRPAWVGRRPGAQLCVRRRSGRGRRPTAHDHHGTRGAVRGSVDCDASRRGCGSWAGSSRCGHAACHGPIHGPI